MKTFYITQKGYIKTSPGKIVSTLICQNQTSLQGKVAPWRTSAGPRVARQVREGQVTAKWEDFGKLLVKKARP